MICVLAYTVLLQVLTSTKTSAEAAPFVSLLQYVRPGSYLFHLRPLLDLRIRVFDLDMWRY